MMLYLFYALLCIVIAFGTYFKMFDLDAKGAFIMYTISAIASFVAAFTLDMYIHSLVP